MNDSTSNHDCSKVIAKVILALDGSLSPEEEKEFMKELNQCDGCLEQYDIEKTFKAFLSKKLKRKKVSSNTVNSIRDKIKALALEE